ncbi:MAG: ABC transporter substrate-binding protein [Firmicutes bacterium]|nr:ABC transporter substrate-binding protein [Bacillota bacterium]
MVRWHVGAPLRRLAVIALAMCLAAGASSLGAAAPSKDRVRLSEVVRSVFYAPQYVALELGFFADENLDIELSTAWGAHNGMAALISGSVDVGFFGPEATIYVYAQGAPDPAVGFAQLTQRDGSFFMARGSVDTFSWDDVRGRLIVGARKGGVPQMVLEWVLRQHGIEPFRDVGIITHLAFEAAAGAFQGGLGDYVAQFEPAMTSMERAGVGTIVASLGAEAGDVTYTVYHARRSYLEQNPGVIERFVRAIYRGQQWVHAHSSEEIAGVVAPFFPGMDFDILVTALERYRSIDAWTLTPAVSREGFAHLQEIMAAAGELPHPVPFDEVMTNTFAERVVNGEE